jgi:cytochrome c biogenesis protein CcmG, thiol:disulfide interchange protein DsbE
MKKYSVAIPLAVAGLVIVAAVLHGMRVVPARSSASRGRQTSLASVASGKSLGASAHGQVVRFASNAMLAPPFLLPDLNGNIISTADWHDKAVLLIFWATWCPPCREEIPELIDLASRYKDRLQIVAVSMDDAPREEIREFAERFGINYSIVMSSPEMISEYGGVPALPTSFVISPEGRVVQKHVGLYPEEVYETEVRALLGLPVNATITTFQDTGQIFLKNASLATELPGVDLKGLNDSQKKAVLKRLNAQSCDCGCKLTLAQCRVNDTSCPVSRQEAAEIVKQALAGPPAPAVQTSAQ